jgi:hypothetical protein
MSQSGAAMCVICPTLWSAVASEARHRSVVNPVRWSARTNDPRVAQSAVAAALCRRTPQALATFEATRHFVVRVVYKDEAFTPHRYTQLA